MPARLPFSLSSTWARASSLRMSVLVCCASSWTSSLVLGSDVAAILFSASPAHRPAKLAVSMGTRLDRWLDRPAVRTRHERSADASPDELWRAAQDVRLADTRLLGRVVRWRLPGTPPDATFADVFRAYPFTVLDDGEHHLVSGLCGRIWTLARDYPRLTGVDEFARWDQPGTVRVLFAHWVEHDAGDGRTTLVSEARVQPVDRHAARRLRAVWALVGGFERLIGAEPLPVAARRALGEDRLERHADDLQAAGQAVEGELAQVVLGDAEHRGGVAVAGELEGVGDARQELAQQVAHGVGLLGLRADGLAQEPDPVADVAGVGAGGLLLGRGEDPAPGARAAGD